MNTSKKSTVFLTELKDFLAFLQNLWGILAGISVFFPLSNVLIKYIPMKHISEDGAFVNLSPPLITTLATIVTLFVVLWTFGKRHRLNVDSDRKNIVRQAWISFGVGFAALVAYLALYFISYYLAYPSWGWESDDPRHMLTELPLLIIYCTFFASITRAFMMLGMSEYYAKTTDGK